jgi:rubrerythrin
MMSKIPLKPCEQDGETKDMQFLRTALISELDAINLYEQMAAEATSPLIKKTLLEVAKDEKTHVGSFAALLLDKDQEQVDESEAGAKEVSESAQ